MEFVEASGSWVRMLLVLRGGRVRGMARVLILGIIGAPPAGLAPGAGGAAGAELG